MPSSYTANLGIELIGSGEQAGTWDDTTNLNFQMFDRAINGYTQITLPATGTSGAPNALAITDGALSDGHYPVIEYVDGGDLGGTAYVQLQPNDAQKVVTIKNSLTNSRDILVFQGTYSSARDYRVVNGTTATIVFEGAGTTSNAYNIPAGTDMSGYTATCDTLEATFYVHGNGGVASAPAFAFIGDPNTGMYNSGVDELAFSTASTLAAYFDASQDYYMFGTEYHLGMGRGTFAGTGYIRFTTTASSNDCLIQPFNGTSGYDATNQLWYDFSATTWKFAGDAQVDGNFTTNLANVTSTGDLAVGNGGTGASTASAARTNLGVAIGSDVQAWDTNLDQIAALTPTNSNFIVGNGSAWVVETGATARASLGLGSLATLSSVNDGNWSGTDLAVVNGGTGSSTASGARTNLGLVIGTNVQAWDADLDAYASNPLTASELDQLQNINATTISATQWTYVGNLNQNLRTTDDVVFNDVMSQSTVPEFWLYDTDGTTSRNKIRIRFAADELQFASLTSGSVFNGNFWQVAIADSGGGTQTWRVFGDNDMQLSSTALTLDGDNYNPASASGNGIEFVHTGGHQITVQRDSGTANNVDMIRLFQGATQTFEVQADGDVNNTNGSAIGTISSITVKENVADARSQIDDIMGIRLRNFDFNLPTDTPEQKASRPRQLGVIAEELKEVCPGLVKEREDGLPVVKTGLLYMKLLKAFQELVEDYESKVGPINRKNTPTAAALAHDAT